MNRIIFSACLILFSQSIFAQTETVKVKIDKNLNVKTQANIAEISNAKSEPKIDVKVRLTEDLYKYSTIAIVDASFNGGTYADRYSYRTVNNLLSNSPLDIINPFDYDKKRYKKESKKFLRKIKNSDWLYLYYVKSMVGVDEIRSIIVRDYKNRIIFNVTTTNTSAAETISPLVNF